MRVRPVVSYIEEDDDVYCRVKVIGIGGAGLRALDTMIAAKMPNVEFIAADTDIKALRNSKAQKKIQLGIRSNRGFGCGSDRDLGREAAEEALRDIGEAIRWSGLIFIVAGMGSGTGTGASPVFADAAIVIGKPVIGLVTLPVALEGENRIPTARDGICNLSKRVDSLIVVSNDSVMNMLPPHMEISDAFKAADIMLMEAVQGISGLLTKNGLKDINFSNLNGPVVMGVGMASGNNRAKKAASRAMTRISWRVDITRAKNVLINISGSSDITMDDYDSVGRVFHEVIREDAKITIATTTDERIAFKSIKVTAFYSNFENSLGKMLNEYLEVIS